MAQKNLVSRSNRAIRLAGSGAMPRRVPGDCRGQFCGFPHLSTEIALASRPKQHLPEPSRPTRPKSAMPDRPKPSPGPADGAVTAGTAGERLKETGKALLPREAAQRHQQGRSTQRSGPAQPSQGRFGAAPQAWPTCGQPAPSQMRAGGRGAGGLGADWAAGAVGSRAGCAAGRPLCAREGKRGRAGGR